MRMQWQLKYNYFLCGAGTARGSFASSFPPGLAIQEPCAQHTRVVVQDPRDTVNSTRGLVHIVHHRRLTPQVELRCRLYGPSTLEPASQKLSDICMGSDECEHRHDTYNMNTHGHDAYTYVHIANSHSSACDFSLTMGIAQGATADREVKTWSFARRSLAGLLGTSLLAALRTRVPVASPNPMPTPR